MNAALANARTTALAGAVLLVLSLIELVTVPAMRVLLAVHVLVGVLFVGPLAVKLGSTGYRFLFVRRALPGTGLLLVAPVLGATTLVVVGSGIALLVVGPARDVPLLQVHVIGCLLWLPAIALHALAHLRSLPRLVLADWRNGRRLGVGGGALAGGAIAAVALLPQAGPWLAWVETHEVGSRPFLVGLALAALALAAFRPSRW